MVKDIRRAEEFISRQKHLVNPEFRPVYHAAAPCGWINDPNGFCFFGGKYHLFFQFNPYSSVWDSMHWGHWTSKDLVSWEWAGVALAPDMPYDSFGVFSGHAVVKDNTLYLIYTGVYTDEEGKQRQVQCIAFSKDGINFTKYEKNPVITADQLPEGASLYDFRDPKVFRHNDKYRMVVASRGQKGGDLLLFDSGDLIHWEYVEKHIEGMAVMLECPDYFELDDHTVTVVSTIGMPFIEGKYSSPQPVLGLVDVEKNGPVGDALDIGYDFYAPQTLLTPDGRRIMIGWMFMGPNDFPPRYLGHNWNNLMTVPRELRIENGRILQLPAKELNACRGKESAFAGKTISGKCGRIAELSIDIDVNDANEITLRTAESEGEYFLITYDVKSQVISLDRSKAGYLFGKDGATEERPNPKAILPAKDGKLGFSIYMDRSSCEVFSKDGSLVMSTLICPKGEADGFFCASDNESSNFAVTTWEIVK